MKKINIDHDSKIKHNSDLATTEEQIIKNTYEAEDLVIFSDCFKLCQTIDIKIKNDFPLVLVMSAGSLGKMFVSISPTDMN
jgi:hypothetical protein